MNKLTSSFPHPYKRIRIFPDRDLRATILEMAMIDTRIMQRLRNTKQLGNSNVSYPTADHSRFAHSLGVLYWCTKILTSLNDNHNAIDNKPLLKKMNDYVKSYLKEKLSYIDNKIFEKEDFLGVTWFEQLVRLYALLHDITHIPYGHTLEDQANLFERHDDDLKRLCFVFDMLKKEVHKSYHFEDKQYENELLQIATEYIDLVQSIFVVGYLTSDSNFDNHKRGDWTQEQKEEWENQKESWLSAWNKVDDKLIDALLLTYDIVSNTICADLMDYTLRDTLFASMPKTFDKALLTYMKIVKQDTIFYLPKSEPIKKNMYRLGVNISRKKIRHDIITAILDLLRIRYDLTEKVYYHHTKVITDAMLEKVLRLLPTDKKRLSFTQEEIDSLKFTTNQIYENYLGDEGFLNLLETRLKSAQKLSGALEILNKIFKRNLYKATFRINLNEPLSQIGTANLSKCSTPEGRDDVEKALVNELSFHHGANIEEGDLIISFPPKKMQMKIAKALIEWFDGQVFPFEKLPLETNYSNEVGVLTERYKTLWSLTVFLNPQKKHYIRLVESVCENFFDVHNEFILKSYLRKRYQEYYESADTMKEIDYKVIAIESQQISSRAAKGGSQLTKETKIELTEDAYEQTINERRKDKGKASKPQSLNKEEDLPKLDFKESQE